MSTTTSNSATAGPIATKMGFDSTTYRTPQYAFSETSSVDIPASASDTSDDVPQDEYDTTNDDTEDPSTHFSEAKVADLRKVQESRELAAMWADKLQFQTCLLQLKMLSIDKTESQSEAENCVPKHTSDDTNTNTNTNTLATTTAAAAPVILAPIPTRSTALLTAELQRRAARSYAARSYAALHKAKPYQAGHSNARRPLCHRTEAVREGEQVKQVKPRCRARSSSLPPMATDLTEDPTAPAMSTRSRRQHRASAPSPAPGILVKHSQSDDEASPLYILPSRRLRNTRSVRFALPEPPVCGASLASPASPGFPEPETELDLSTPAPALPLLTEANLSLLAPTKPRISSTPAIPPRGVLRHLGACTRHTPYGARSRPISAVAEIVSGGVDVASILADAAADAARRERRELREGREKERQMKMKAAAERTRRLNAVQDSFTPAEEDQFHAAIKRLREYNLDAEEERTAAEDVLENIGRQRAVAMSKAKRKQNLREAKQKLEDEIQRRKSAAEGFTPITLTLTTSHPDDDQPAVSIFLPPPTLPMTPSLSTASTLVSPSFPSTPETVMEYGTGLAAPAAPTALAALATFGFEPQADDAEKSSREATSRRMAALHRSAAAMAAIASSSANVAKEELANLLAGLHGLNAQALLASDLLRPALTQLSTNTPRNVSSPSKMDRNAGLTTPPAVLARTPKTSWRMILPSPTTPTPVHASARIQARGSLTVAPAMFHGSARGVRNEPYARPQRVPKTQEVREVPTDAELVEAMKELDVSQPEVIRRQVATM